MLTQSEQCGQQVAGLREISKELRTRMTSFTRDLEAARETIDATAQCYQQLDQVGVVMLMRGDGGVVR